MSSLSTAAMGTTSRQAPARSAPAALFADLPQRRKWLPLPFLAGAALVHLALLWLDFDEHEAAPSQVSVEVQLEAARPAVEAPPQPLIEPLPQPTPQPLAQPLESTAVKAAEVTPAPAEKPADDSQAVPIPDREPAASLALEREALLEAVSRMDWQITAPATTLSRPQAGDSLEQLYRPLLPASDNTFDGMTAPAETEIVDRWQDPGGTHQVVIRSPDGNTYCGRQEAPDDFRPWLQMPMMFRKCGGGGKRRANSPWRNN